MPPTTACRATRYLVAISLVMSAICCTAPTYRHSQLWFGTSETLFLILETEYGKPVGGWMSSAIEETNIWEWKSVQQIGKSTEFLCPFGPPGKAYLDRLRVTLEPFTSSSYACVITKTHDGSKVFDGLLHPFPFRHQPSDETPVGREEAARP